MTPQLILIIEDDPDCSKVISALIQYIWSETTIVCLPTLKEVLGLLEECTPDLVITDLYIPPTVIDPICKNPRLTMEAWINVLPVDIPIVAISGYLTPLEGQEMLAIGADAFITKGVSAEMIQRIILSSWLRSRGHQHRCVVRQTDTEVLTC